MRKQNQFIDIHRRVTMHGGINSSNYSTVKAGHLLYTEGKLTNISIKCSESSSARSVALAKGDLPLI